jgi:uncharacterized protein YbjT (DUF2867 family)
MRVFVAGATGAVGRRLVPLLVAHGHDVTAMTRTPRKAWLLRRLGAEPVVADGLDEAAVMRAVTRSRADVVVHEMTGLAGVKGVRHFDREFALTNRLRTEGTQHLSPRRTPSGRAASSPRASATGTTSGPGPQRRPRRTRSIPIRRPPSASRWRRSAPSSARSSTPTA